MDRAQFNEAMIERGFDYDYLWSEGSWTTSDISFDEHEVQHVLARFGGDFEKVLDYVDEWIKTGLRPRFQFPSAHYETHVTKVTPLDAPVQGLPILAPSVQPITKRESAPWTRLA